MDENADAYVNAPIYDGKTKGKINSVKIIFDPLNLNLEIIREEDKPKIRLIVTTPTTNEKVLKNNS